MRSRLVALSLVITASACREQSPRPDSDRADSTTAAAAVPAAVVSAGGLIESRIPLAAAGDSGWTYQQRVRANLDADGTDETIVLIADVTSDSRGQPLWDDGHRWQVYVEERDGRRTHVYARFLPMGKLTANLSPSDSGGTAIVLLEETPHWLGAYVIRYQGPGRSTVPERFQQELDRTRSFEGSPRP